MTKKIQKKVAEIISVTLHPFFLVLLLILLGIEKSNLPSSQLTIFTVFALFFNGLLPVCYTFYLTKKGMVLDDSLENKEVLKNRPFVLAGGTIILFLEIMALRIFKNPEPLFVILLTLLFLIFTLFLITLYRKISLHVALTSAFSLTILFIFGYSFWPILFLIPLIFWSRFFLKRHTKKQMAAAFILGLFIPILVFYGFGLLP